MIELILAALALFLFHLGYEKVAERALLRTPRLNEHAIDRELRDLDHEFALELGIEPERDWREELARHVRDQHEWSRASLERNQRPGQLIMMNNAAQFIQVRASQQALNGSNDELRAMVLAKIMQNRPHWAP